MTDDWYDWRILIRNKIVLAAVLILLLFLVLLFYQLAHGMPICRAPSVPVSQLDPRFDKDDGCATIGEDRVFHGVWVDTFDGALFYPDATNIPPGKVGKTDAWLYIDRTTRDAIYHNLPAIDGTLGFQVISISFSGSEYTLDHPTRDGLKRLFDVRDVRSARVLRREYMSAPKVVPKDAPKPT